jgi:hypothetical protein
VRCTLVLVVAGIPQASGAVADERQERATASRALGEIRLVDTVLVDKPLGAAVLADETAIHTPTIRFRCGAGIGSCPHATSVLHRVARLRVLMTADYIVSPAASGVGAFPR